MTTFLFGNSNRRHIADPANADATHPDVTACGIMGYQTAADATVWFPYQIRAAEIARLMAFPLCADCQQETS